jgi:hypothetical protein
MRAHVLIHFHQMNWKRTDFIQLEKRHCSARQSGQECFEIETPGQGTEKPGYLPVSRDFCSGDFLTMLSARRFMKPMVIKI